MDKRYTTLKLGVVAVFTAFYSVGYGQAYPRELQPTEFVVAEISSVFDLLNYMYPKSARRFAINIPIHAFTLNDNLCAYYCYDFLRRINKWREPGLLNETSQFIVCIDSSKNKFNTLSLNYVHEALGEGPSKGSAIREAFKKENIEKKDFRGVIAYVPLKDKLLVFYEYRPETNKENELQEKQVLLFVKEYTSRLQFRTKHKLLIGEERVPASYRSAKYLIYGFGKKYPIVFVSEPIIKPAGQNHFVVIYGTYRVGAGKGKGPHSRGKGDHVSVVIKYFNKNLKKENEIIIPLFISSVPELRPIVFSEEQKLYFAIPVVLYEEDERKKNIFKRLLGKSKSVRSSGLFLVIYQVDLKKGTYDFGAIDLGNPEKDVTSLLIKKSEIEKDVFYIGLLWSMKKDIQGADIVKLKVTQDGLSLVEKTTWNLTKSNTARIITDITETDNHYLLFHFEQFITMVVKEEKQERVYEQDVYYKVLNKNPLLTLLNKKTKEVTSVDLTGQKDAKIEYVAVRNLADIKGSAPIRDYETGLLKFVHIDKNTVMGIYPLGERAAYLPLRFKEYYLKTYYVLVHEKRNGSIEYTRGRLLGPSQGNASSLGGKATLVKDGKIYIFYSIDGHVPALLKFEPVKH